MKYPSHFNGTTKEFLDRLRKSNIGYVVENPYTEFQPKVRVGGAKGSITFSLNPTMEQHTNEYVWCVRYDLDELTEYKFIKRDKLLSYF